MEAEGLMKSQKYTRDLTAKAEKIKRRYYDGK